jgi:integrase
VATRKIEPTKARSGYRVVFRHPVHRGDPVSRGLGTDKHFADAVCFVLNLICNDAVLCQADITAISEVKLREVGYGKAAKKALEIFYGPHAAIEKIFDAERGLTDADLAQVRRLAEKWNVEEAGKPNSEEYDDESGRLIQTDPEPEINPRVVSLVMERFGPALVREQRTQIEQLQMQLQGLSAVAAQVNDLQEENKQLLRRLNLHVKEKIGIAEQKWLGDLRKDRSAQHAENAERWIEKFIETLPGQKDFPLSELRRQHAIAWLRGMSNKPRTLQNRRNFVTGFVRWCVNEYDMINPLQNLPTIKGVSIQNRVVAIQKHDEFKQLLSALDSAPYWKTLVATCVLAGPREGEVLRLRIDDVKPNSLEVHATKTDRRFRVVPIEETELLPLLKAHVERRQNERETATSPVPLKSDLLFPSLSAPGTIERTKSKPEPWSGPRAFLTAFERSMKDARATEQVSDKFRESAIWDYTPQIYRHTFGSILARTGKSALQISRLMGNSPGVAATHYIDQFSHLEPWPVQWPKRIVEEF